MSFQAHGQKGTPGDLGIHRRLISFPPDRHPQFAQTVSHERPVQLLLSLRLACQRSVRQV